MAKYDVELITDKHGRPLPQYYDEQEGVMKPITHDNFNGKIVGDVNAIVEFPELQKVEITNPVDMVSVDNLPDVQRVEVTNAQSQIDVNVLNPVESVSVTNLPSNQEVTVTNPVELPSDYPDSAVKQELEQIKQVQAQVLERLDGVIDTRVTGSDMEYAQGYKETVSFSRTGSLDAGAFETVVEINEPCILESLMVGTSYNTMIIRIEERRPNGSYGSGMRLVAPDGTSANPVNPSSLNSLGGENDYWNLFNYDTERNRYAFGMKRQSVFGSGLRIRIQNNNSVAHTMGLTCLITKMHDNKGVTN